MRIVATAIKTGSPFHRRARRRYNRVTKYSQRYYGLTPTGSVQVHTPSSGSGNEVRDTFDACLAFDLPGLPQRTFTIPVIGTEFFGQNFLVLMGWDILRECVLVANGPAGRVELRLD